MVSIYRISYYINTTPQVTLASVANLPLEYDVETYKIVYNTIDALAYLADLLSW